jgi:hypothetical protein
VEVLSDLEMISDVLTLHRMPSRMLCNGAQQEDMEARLSSLVRRNCPEPSELSYQQVNHFLLLPFCSSAPLVGAVVAAFHDHHLVGRRLDQRDCCGLIRREHVAR